MRKRFLSIGLVLVLLLSVVGMAGCAAEEEEEPTELITPAISMERVDILYADDSVIVFEWLMKVSNPNEIPVTLDYLTVDYYVDDLRLAKGYLLDKVYIPGESAVVLSRPGIIKVMMLPLTFYASGITDMAQSAAKAGALVGAINGGEAEWRFKGETMVDSKIGSESVAIDLYWS